MDTATVLEIIKMINTHLFHLETNPDIGAEESETASKHLICFRDHLQSFIEGQLNNAENSTGE